MITKQKIYNRKPKAPHWRIAKRLPLLSKAVMHSAVSNMRSKAKLGKEERETLIYLNGQEISPLTNAKLEREKRPYEFNIHGMHEIGYTPHRPFVFSPKAAHFCPTQERCVQRKAEVDKTK